MRKERWEKKGVAKRDGKRDMGNERTSTERWEMEIEKRYGEEQGSMRDSARYMGKERWKK
jgi:hypothetical protein